MAHRRQSVPCLTFLQSKCNVKCLTLFSWISYTVYTHGNQLVRAGTAFFAKLVILEGSFTSLRIEVWKCQFDRIFKIHTFQHEDFCINTTPPLFWWTQVALSAGDLREREVMSRFGLQTWSQLVQTWWHTAAWLCGLQIYIAKAIK